MQTGWDFTNNMMEAKEKNGITENFDDIVCVHNEFCGGCSFQNISYAEQLEIKENEILTLIDKKKLSVNLIEKIEPSPIKFQYRNKMEYTFGDLVKDGEMTLGMHKRVSYVNRDRRSVSTGSRRLQQGIKSCFGICQRERL